MIKKLFKKLMADETSDAAAFLGFGIFVLILCIILSFFSFRVSINTEKPKNVEKIEEIVNTKYPNDTLINLDIKPQATWKFNSEIIEVIPVVFDKVSCGDTIPYVAYVSVLPRLFHWKLGSVYKESELLVRW